MAAAHTQPPGGSLVLIDGVPVGSAAGYFTDSDDEEPQPLEESTTFKWDEFILHAAEENVSSSVAGRRKLRKAGGLVRMMSSLTGQMYSADSSIQEARQDFASTAEGLAATLAKRYGAAATAHLAQLHAEITQFGLCDDLEDGVAFPPSHTAVGDELARRVAEVVADELEFFRKESTWSAGAAAGPQVEGLLRSLREFDDVQLEQVTFVTEQTARRAHLAKVQEMEKKLDGIRAVAMAAQGAGVQRLWNDWQQKETELMRRVVEAEAAAAEAAQRAATARRMYESAEELAKHKQEEKARVNKQLDVQASIVAGRNRALRKERDGLLAEVSRLEYELAQKSKRCDILCAQREQTLAGKGTANPVGLKIDAGTAQAREQTAAHLEQLRTMKERFSRDLMASSNNSIDSAGVQRQTSETAADLTDSSVAVSTDERGGQAAPVQFGRRSAHPERDSKLANGMRRHKSTPSGAFEMTRHSKPTKLSDKANMIISKDGKLAMQRPSLKLAALNDEYAAQALAQLRASIAQGTHSISKTSAVADGSGMGGMLAAAIGGSDHLVPPASRMRV